MKYPVTLALGLLALALPATAMADNHLTDADIRLGDDVWELRIEAEQNLGEPRIRTMPGYARVWFPHMGTSHIDRDGDGRAVRFVRVRAGYEDTAVAIIRFGDMRRLPEGALSVVRSGTVARIRIARSALPAPVAAPAIAPPEDIAEDLSAAEELPTEDTAATSEAPGEVTETAPAEATSPEPAEAAPIALTRSTQAAPLPSGDGPSTILVLLGLTLLLGGLYLGIRAFGKHRNQRKSHIEVVAQKRIGARQQLLVVRALGEDHLIAVQGGRTERLASMPAPEDAFAGQGGGDGEELLPFLKLGRKDTGENKVPTVHRQTTERTLRTREERPRFGAELMRLVAERGTADRVTLGANTVGLGSPATAGGPSEAVAGLLRLREKLGR
ncbi:MAG: flagellar biosynthetic protein FliO [Sandaracinaceae bacterium]